jgi:putative endonuclease
VRRGRLLVAVEVKARAGGDGWDVVAANQRRRIARALDWWLARHARFADKDVRFDLVVVAPGRWPVHVPHALDPA